MIPKLIPLEKTPEEVRQTILTNVVRMLTYRNWINPQAAAAEIKKLIGQYSDNLAYTIKLKNNKSYHIKFTGQKVTTVNNTFGLKDFLYNNKADSSLVIVKDISKKALEHVHRHYPTSEVFSEDELMLDLSTHVLFHPHEKILDRRDEANIKKFVDDYSLSTKRKIPKMLEEDISSRYLNMKRGDICRILRPSETSGYVPCYRLVI